MTKDLLKLWISLTGLLLLNSCGIRIDKLERQSADLIKIQSRYDKLQYEQVYDLGLQFGKNYNSGILAVVRDTNNLANYRVVFLAKAGMKLFDISFSEKEIEVHHVFDALNKRLFLKILEQDIRMIFDRTAIASPEYFIDTDSANSVIRSKTDNYLYYYLDDQNRVIQMDKGTKRRSRVRLNIEYDHPMVPIKMNIQHKRIPFTMSLNRISSPKK